MASMEPTDRFIRSLFEDSPAPIVAIDTEDRVAAWNPAAERLFGWRADEILGQIYPLVPEDGELKYRQVMSSVLGGETIPAYEVPRQRKDGTLVHVSIALAPIRDAAGEISGAFGIYKDITRRKLAEERLERLNAVLLAIREVNQLIVREKDRERLLDGVCNCLLINQGYNTAWIALQDASGNLELRAEAGLAAFRADLGARLEEGKLPRCIAGVLDSPGVLRIEDRVNTCGGCPLEQAFPGNEAVVAPIEHDGKVLGLLGLSLPSGRDMLEEERELIPEIASDVAFALHGLEMGERQRRAEAQASLQREQLVQADKMVALGTLVSGIGHEINNPNNFVMLNMPLIKGVWESALPVLEEYFEEHGELQLRGLPFGKAREMVPQLLDDILEGAWRIKRIVGELKDYARQQPTEHNEQVEINQVVRSAITLCSSFIKQRTQHFSAEYDNELPAVLGNSQRIEQVVINLLQNACEALEDSQRGVSINTTFDEEQDRVVVTIADEGIGIPKENLTRISDPFYTTRRSSGGTGLGLSIADRIIKDHGGALRFESRPGAGTVVRVLLPRSDEKRQGGEP